VKDARQLLPEGSKRKVVADNIATSIRGRNLTPAQAQAALVLAWNDLLSRAQFSFRDFDNPKTGQEQ